MNKIIAAIVALAVIGTPVLAISDIQLHINQPNGIIEFWEKTLGPAGYDSQTGKVQSTASIIEHIVNYGGIDIQKEITTFGTGDAWPNRNSAAQGYGDQGYPYGEWSLYENKHVIATGDTWVNKYVDVWTVHPTWWTDYAVYEVDLDTTNPMTSFSAEGTTMGDQFSFVKHVYTNEDLYQQEVVWVNPWDDVIDEEGNPRGVDPWDNNCWNFPEMPEKPSVNFECTWC